MSALEQEKIYTINDIYALPDKERAELIDGRIYYMAPPTRKHQRIVGELFATIREYINSNRGTCEINISPFAVFLNAAIDSEELLVRMAHLQSRLSFELNGIPITCSCGVSQYPNCGSDFDGLYRAAEQALNMAKDAGKNCFRVCRMCR